MNPFVPFNSNQVGLIGKTGWNFEEDEGCFEQPMNWKAGFAYQGLYDGYEEPEFSWLNCPYSVIAKGGLISRGAANLLKRIGIDSDRFGEPGKKRLMLLAAEKYVENQIYNQNGMDALIALFEQTDGQCGTAFLHSFIPFLAGKIRSFAGEAEVSLRAHQFMMAQAKLESLKGENGNWGKLGRAVYGDAEFAKSLSNVRLGHDQLKSRVAEIAAS